MVVVTTGDLCGVELDQMPGLCDACFVEVVFTRDDGKAPDPEDLGWSPDADLPF
jgi:hypothetical protein